MADSIHNKVFGTSVHFKEQYLNVNVYWRPLEQTEIVSCDMFIIKLLFVGNFV